MLFLHPTKMISQRPEFALEESIRGNKYDTSQIDEYTREAFRSESIDSEPGWENDVGLHDIAYIFLP